MGTCIRAMLSISQRSVYHQILPKTTESFVYIAVKHDKQLSGILA